MALAKNNKSNKGKFLKALPETVTLQGFKHPIFCFKYLHKDFNLSQCDESEKIALLERVVLLSGMTWQEIQLAPRHGLGSEKISVSSIKPSIPEVVTEDVGDLLAMRFHGKMPFVGLRNKFIFHIFYVDRNHECY